MNSITGKKPILIHVNAYLDLPNEEEISSQELKNLITQNDLRNLQRVLLVLLIRILV